ncbi:MAG TPA: EAL domain-containing protein [Gemmatimonadales bacterium]
MAETMLDRILQPGNLTVVFQPIMQHRATGWHLHAFEALVRGPKGTNLESAEVLFAYGRRKRAEAQIDRMCIRQILQSALALGGGVRLTLNVHAITLEQDEGFVRFLLDLVEASPFSASRITLEIVEHSPSWSEQRFANVLLQLREAGFSFALDDIGLGQSNYRMILGCRPDYFKIDRFLVAGSSRDFYRRAVLRSIGDLAGSFGAYAVAEGIDNVDDLAAVLGEGLDTVQGFLLAKPAAATTLGSGDFVRHAARRLPEDGAVPPWAGTLNWLALAGQQLAYAANDSLAVAS